MTSRRGYIDRYARRGPARTLLAVATLAGSAAATDAALWESPTWGLTGMLETGCGYDSNLLARSADMSASYLSAAPSLLLSRRASLTRLDITGRLEGTTYLSGDVRDALDPSLRVLLEYPRLEDVDPGRELEASWGRRDVTNADLGRRVRTEEYILRGHAIILDTGRTRFGAGVSGRSQSYDAADLNTNHDILVEGGVGYAVTPSTHLGLGYAHEWGRSLGAAGRADIDRAQDQVLVQARGRLLPKVSGTARAGLAWIDYSGGIVRSDQTWVADASLEWFVSQLTAATVRARRGADFSPDGQSVIRSSLEVEFSRVIRQAWRIRAGGGVSRLARFGSPDSGDSTAFSTLVGLGYQLTERFSAGVSHRFTQQDSWDPTLDHTRHQVDGQVRFRF